MSSRNIKVSGFPKEHQAAKLHPASYVSCQGLVFECASRTHYVLLSSLAMFILQPEVPFLINTNGICLNKACSGFEPESPVSFRTWTWKAGNSLFRFLAQSSEMREVSSVIKLWPPGCEDSSAKFRLTGRARSRKLRRMSEGWGGRRLEKIAKYGIVWFVLVTLCCYSDQIKEDGTGVTNITNGGEKECAQTRLIVNPKLIEFLEDQSGRKTQHRHYRKIVVI